MESSDIEQAASDAARAAESEGLSVESVVPFEPGTAPPTRTQMKRFYTGLGMLAGSIACSLLAHILGGVLQDLPGWSCLLIHHIQGVCIVVMGVVIVLGAFRAAVLIRCEDHLLLALADKVRARLREKSEGGTA